MKAYSRLKLIYENALASSEDVKGFVMEGEGTVSFPMGRMRLENLRDPSDGQKANIVYWCNQIFPDNIEISWDFYPIRDPGLAIVFFSAMGQEGESIFSPKLKKRYGEYHQYHSSDINALHISYFRRRYETERNLNLVNLRKSDGFHLVAQGADPIPALHLLDPPYRMTVTKLGADVAFYIEHKETKLCLFSWQDDGETYGEILGGGSVGFRQMAPLIAEYSNMTVYEIE